MAKTTSDLLKEIDAGDVKKIRQRLKKGEKFDSAALDPVDPAWKVFPIHRAVQAGRSNVVELMLEGGADVNSLDDEGTTPLLRAVASPNGANTAAVIGRDAPDGEAPAGVIWVQISLCGLM